MAKSLLGKLKPEAVGILELPRLPAQVLEGFRTSGSASEERQADRPEDRLMQQIESLLPETR